MTITPYSVAMAILWFSMTSLIGCAILPKISRGGLAFVAVIFVFAFIRLVVPLDTSHSVILRSYSIYSALQGVLRAPVIHSLTLGKALQYLWAAGAGIRLIWLAEKLIMQHRFCCGAQVPDDPEISLALAVAKELGYSREIRLGILPNGTTAYQAGFFLPCILLPGNVKAFSQADIRNMLRHELCHFLGFDLWIMLALQIAICLLWWNPVLYLLYHSVEQLLELRCDQRVCSRLSASEQFDYMQTLINLARNGSAMHSHVVMGYTGGSEAKILQRFQLMTQPRAAKTSKVKLLAGYTISVLLFVTSYFFVVQPYVAPPTEEITGSNVEIFTMDSFIIRRPDGSLTLYLDGRAVCSLSENDLDKEPYYHYIIFDTDKEDPLCLSLR